MAPVAVRVVVPPPQNKVGEALAVRVGLGLTETVITNDEVHAPLLPFTVYAVVIDGVTTTTLPDNAPGIQV